MYKKCRRAIQTPFECKNISPRRTIHRTRSLVIDTLRRALPLITSVVCVKTQNHNARTSATAAPGTASTKPSTHPHPTGLLVLPLSSFQDDPQVHVNETWNDLPPVNLNTSQVAQLEQTTRGPQLACAAGTADPYAPGSMAISSTTDIGIHKSGDLSCRRYKICDI